MLNTPHIWRLIALNRYIQPAFTIFNFNRMPFKKNLFSIVVFIFGLSLSALAQRDTLSINTVIAKAVKYSNDRPIEKVYLQTDKPYYAVGDTILFKAYLTMDLHLPSTLSKIVYVDLFNGQDSVMETLKLQVINSVASGRFVLAQTNYKQGNYRLRAYTQWMLNFDAVYLFNKTISVGNVGEDPVITHITFDNAAKNAAAKVDAKILFHDIDEKPFADKKITWRVEIDNDVTSKGKASTDANGAVIINFPPAQLATLTSGILYTVMDLGNRKTVTNSFPLRAATADVDVQFFPEGGSFIGGVRNVVGFKAVKSDGRGVAVKGSVVDNEGKTVISFESQHLGMGEFAMVPDVEKSYKATITLATGAQTTVDLPKVRNGGINLIASNADDDNLIIKLLASDVFFKANQNKTLYIIAQSGGFVKFAAQTRLQNSMYAASIPKSKFQTGLLQITLFNTFGEPLSERVVFIKRNDLLNISVNTDSKTYRQRQKVKLTVNAKAKTLPVAANLSIAVVDESIVPVNEDVETTILSNLLLTSELRGYIEKPNYYFDHTDEKADANLDILMLTQGYRRFVYRDIMADKTPRYAFLPEQGMEISGILRTKMGVPVFKGNVRLIVADKNTSAEAVTDANGIFKFTNVIVPDSSKVTITARNNANANNLVLSIDGEKYPSVSRNVNWPDEVLNIDSALHPYMLNSKRQYANSRLLKEVVIKAAPATKKPSHVDYPSLTGLSMEPDHAITGDRFKGCNNFVSCLQTMVFGLTYDDNNFFVTRDYNAGNKSTPVQIFYNGMPVDFSYLQSVNPAEVESVEIFLKDDLSGINRRYGTNGVLVVNSKKIEKTKITSADLAKLFPPSYILTFSPKGYHIAREFYSPKYEAGKVSSQGVDLRSTIYWNPKVITDKATGNANMEFFNADGRGSYRAIVEGIDGDGNIGRYVYRYKVE